MQRRPVLPSLKGELVSALVYLDYCMQKTYPLAIFDAFNIARNLCHALAAALYSA